MKQSLFDTLARSRIVRSYEEAFHVATGFVLKLQPAGGTQELSPFGDKVNPFCRLMEGSPEARKICKKTFEAIRNKAAETCTPGHSCCFAGITHVAIPVISGGEHIATIYGGQFMLEKPAKRSFEKMASQLVRLGLGSQLASLKQAWFQTPVVTEKQFQAIMYLLETFAGRISQYAATRILEPLGGESLAVTRARKFIQDHFAEAITMPDAARHVHMSASAFSRMFKPAVGVAFNQYLARFRVEQSKAMLANPAAPIRNIAFQSGFDSISQFNRSFRQYAEMSPTRYRAMLAGADPAVEMRGKPSDTNGD